MSEYIKKSIEKKFKLAHILHENGMENAAIAKVVDRKPGTIRTWLKFSTYESFQKSLTRGQRVKPESHDNLSGIMAKLDKIEWMIANLPTVNGLESS